MEWFDIDGFGVMWAPWRSHFTMVSRSLSVRPGKAYGIPGYVVDGNDVLEVRKTVAKAVKRARQGKGPSIVESRTYRYSGHFQGEPQKYRTQKEVQAFRRSRDPIDRFRESLIQEGILTEPRDKEIGDAVSALIEEAVQYAREAPFPRPEDALEDLFVHP